MASSTYKVTSQRQTTVSNGATYVPAMIIAFKTGKGNYGNITVDASDYTLAKVKADLQAAADLLDEVGDIDTIPKS